MYEIVIGRDEADKKRFGLKGTLFLGKLFVKMGQTTSLSNKVLLDIAKPHVILVAGKRGYGKCLHGDTLIQLENGSQIPIKDLANDKSNILSLNNELKIQPSRKTEFFEREVNKLIKIKLRSGKIIKLTLEHPLFTIKGWTCAEELKLGGRIATARKISNFGNGNMSDHKLKLLAYLIAEGHTKKVVLFSNSDKAIVEDFKASLKKFDPNLKLVKEKIGHYRISYPKWKNICLDSSNITFDRERRCFAKGGKIILKKRSIRELIEKENLFGLLSKQKSIPESIIKLNKEKLKLFLNRLFSCDGSIYCAQGIWGISYSSSSEKLIRQVQSLLLKFGVLSKLREKKVKCNGKIFDTFELVSYGENIVKYIKEIGFFGKKQKREKLALEHFSQIEFNQNVDTIPKEIWELYKPKNWAEIGRYVGYAHPKAMRERIKYCPSRQTLLQVAKADKQDGLKMLAESDIFWDEIVSMETLEGNFKVYDICVPEFHNFIANDIIVHNSYSLSVIAEEIAALPKEIANNISVLIFDTMGIFWTMKYPNEREADLLEKWNLEKKGLDVKIYTPIGHYEAYKKDKIPTDYKFSIKPSELTAADWCNVFEIPLTNPIGVLIERIINHLAEKEKDFDIDDIVSAIKKDEKTDQNTKFAAENRFVGAKGWGLFSKEATPIKNLIKGGEVSIIDTSCYTYTAGSWSIKNLVIGLVCKKLLMERMSGRKKEEMESIERGYSYFKKGAETPTMPLIWILIDEAHQSLPREGSTPATDPLVQLLREGRQPGISMVLATQQPGEIHKDVITQSDIVLSHRITARKDIEALNSIMQTYLYKDIMRYFNELPTLKGSAIVLDDNSERMYPIKVRPKLSWHGGESPSPVPVEKSEFEESNL